MDSRAFSGRRGCKTTYRRPARKARHGMVGLDGSCKVKIFQRVGDKLTPSAVPRSLHSKTCGLRLGVNFKYVHRDANGDSCRIRSWVREGHPPRCGMRERCHAGSTVIQSPGGRSLARFVVPGPPFDPGHILWQQIRLGRPLGADGHPNLVRTKPHLRDVQLCSLRAHTSMVVYCPA